MHRIAGLHLTLIVAASIWSVPALALDYRNAIAGSFCDADGYVDYRMPSVRRDHSSSLQAGCNDLIGADGIIGLNPMRVGAMGASAHEQALSAAGVAALKIDGVRYQPGRLGTDQTDMEMRRSLDRMKLLVADSGTPRFQSVGSTAGKGEGMPIVLDNAGRTTHGSTGRRPSGGVGDARQGIELSLLQSSPIRLAGAAQAGDDRQAEQWVWTSDGSTAEPGIWIVLIAGFLGMCAVARRRILIS
ncbi:MAG: hypothetical protein WD795_18245 [Woeseia sp.]